MNDQSDEDPRRPGRRARYATSEPGRVPRPLWIAMLGVVAVAAFLIWPRGGGLRDGGGESVRVVAADTSASAPRSSEVDITTARRPIVAEQPLSGRFALEVGAFDDERAALALRDDLAAKGYPAQLRSDGTADSATVYRVWVGTFASRAEAAAYAGAHREDLARAVPVQR